jgi:hypothetical protein
MPCRTVLSPIVISSHRVGLGSGSRPERPLESGEYCCPRGAGTTIHAQRTPRTRPMQACDHGAALGMKLIMYPVVQMVWPREAVHPGVCLETRWEARRAERDAM